MILKDFEGISIRGRVAFCLDGINKYMLSTYKKEAWSFFYNKFIEYFQLKCINEWDDELTEMCPDVIEFYDEYVSEDFEYLKEKEFYLLKSFYSELDEEAKTCLDLIHQMSGVYLYSTPDIECSLMSHDFKMIKNFLFIKGFLPNVEDYKCFSYNECNGWGREGVYNTGNER